MKGIKRGKEFTISDDRNSVQCAIKQNMPLVYWFYLKVGAKWELKDIRCIFLPSDFSGMNWKKRLTVILKLINKD